MDKHLWIFIKRIILISRLPFDWRNLPTYLQVVVIQCMAVTYLFHLIAALLVYGIGNYVFGMVATAQFKKCLKRLDKTFQSKTDFKQSMKGIAVIVRYHSALQQLCIRK